MRPRPSRKCEDDIIDRNIGINRNASAIQKRYQSSSQFQLVVSAFLDMTYDDALGPASAPRSSSKSYKTPFRIKNIVLPGLNVDHFGIVKDLIDIAKGKHVAIVIKNYWWFHQ